MHSTFTYILNTKVWCTCEVLKRTVHKKFRCIICAEAMLISYNGTIFNRATEEKRYIYLNEGTAELQQIQEHLEVNVAGNILFCDAMPVVRTIGQGSRQ